MGDNRVCIQSTSGITQDCIESTSGITQDCIESTSGITQDPAPIASMVWIRQATPREVTLGLKTDGSIKNVCSNLEILSSVEIEKDVLEKCADHFNRDMTCFREFLMEKEDSHEIWLVKTSESNFLVEQLEEEEEIDINTIEDEINNKARAEDDCHWKLYFNYVGFDASESDDSHLYPHIYQFIFVFSTGTLDEFSCALICDLFLNILDCAIKDVPFTCYSHLNMYNIGINLENRISNTIEGMLYDRRYLKRAKRGYEDLVNNLCSNFNFEKKHLENKELPFKTLKCLFSSENTKAFLDICKEKDMGVYAVFIVIINNVLLRHAKRNGFKGTFRAKVLHMINARHIFKGEDKKCLYKLGSHFIPYMQNFKLESTEIKEIFKEAPIVESDLERVTKKDLYWEQEALKEIFILKSGTKYNCGRWNSNYCFSLANLGNLDDHYCSENPKNSIKVLSYERSSSPMEGGYLDVVFYTFKKKLVVHFDFSQEYFTNTEMLLMIKSFSDVVEAII